MAGNDIADTINRIPIITRYWLLSTVFFTLIGRFGLVDPLRMFLIWPLITQKFEIWRPITALLFYPLTPSTGFHFLMYLYFLYSYSVRLENDFFFGRTADYVFLLLFTWVTLLIVSLFVTFYVLLEPMVLSVLYIWSQLNRDMLVQFFFGVQFKAMYFPWALVVFNFIVRGSALLELVGIIVGHIYYFFMFQYPQEYGGQAFLKTPSFLYRLFPNQRGGISGFGQAPPARRQQPSASSTGRFPGRGQVLGHDE